MNKSSFQLLKFSVNFSNGEHIAQTPNNHDKILFYKPPKICVMLFCTYCNMGAESQDSRTRAMQWLGRHVSATTEELFRWCFLQAVFS
jgi:hypothetical protein